MSEAMDHLEHDVTDATPATSSEVDARHDELIEGSDAHYEQAAQVEWTPLPPIPQTGDPRVDDAGARLADLNGLDLHEHPDVFQDVHDRLRAVLSDDAPAAR